MTVATVGKNNVFYIAHSLRGTTVRLKLGRNDVASINGEAANRETPLLPGAHGFLVRVDDAGLHVESESLLLPIEEK